MNFPFFIFSKFVLDRHNGNRRARQANVILSDASISSRTDTNAKEKEIFSLSWAYYYLSLSVTVDFNSKVISNFPLFSWHRLKAGLQVRSLLRSILIRIIRWQRACILMSLVFMHWFSFFCITFELMFSLSAIVRLQTRRKPDITPA